jgi:hypothetical protein
MATSVRTTSVAPPARALSRADDMPWHLAAVVAGATSILIGIVWDISWHRTIGRDSFWTPAHMAVYIGGTLAGLSCGARVLRDSFFSGARPVDGVRLWKFFVGPSGGWICIWGAFAMLVSAPFDDWWHGAYGLDVEILSPPHVVLLVGIAAILTGAQVMAAVAQNRNTESRVHANVFGFATGVMVTMAAVALTDQIWLGRQHRSDFYIVMGAAFPMMLVSASVASRAKWAATTAALCYMLFMAAQVWILPLFPATPKLGPIGHEVTHMVPMPFPVLLLLPAIVIDLIVQRRREANPWVTSLMIGVGFIAALLLSQWPMAALLSSEIGRHPFFGYGYDNYETPAKWLVGPNPLWPEDGGLPVTIRGIALWSVLAATVSARWGLRRGDWLRRVVR